MIGEDWLVLWAARLSAIAAGLGAVAYLFRRWLWPLSQAAWAAILAAPVIARGVDNLVELAQGTWLEKVTELTEKLTELVDKVSGQGTDIELLKAWQEKQDVALLEHGERISRLERVE